MQQYPNIKSVRIEIEPSVPISLAASWIRQARDSGYKVIATYHKYTVLGSDDTTQLDSAARLVEGELYHPGGSGLLQRST